ncbi:curli-like amyloid fiber formation chaperone CsgH [Roseibacterium beibuensis]|uniref:CsgH-like domain-containing protein n=1 Tax=[Roseibacterium] beibuensis TaxID=1193142 RepID=A0ABP9LEQ7_9RHOB|nr:curli-like amyloid fiber formation chaperone CsgH [Roseibacterium beibuensis]MCS6626513.1 curli-like amyloid fiber formation chaperone CsgH [Roseibacterium beibuensis]
MTLSSFTLRAALGTALAAAALGCTAIAETGSTHATPGPVACAVAVTPSGSSLVIEGVVEAREPLVGSYSLSVTGPGTRMNQGGPIAVDAGETLRLGRVQMGGTATNGLTAELTLEVDGETYRCPAEI